MDSSRRNVFLEVCVDSVCSARNALEGGAQRLELCSALTVGGLTPSVGLARCVRGLAVPFGVPVMAMIRAREGADFCFSKEEMDVMLDDLVQLKGIVDGFVVGVLTGMGEIDVVNTRRLVDMAHPLPCTFHRAFDVCTQPMAEAMERVASTGCSYVLTSGMQRTALEGVVTLKAMSELEGSVVVGVIAGAGVTAATIPLLLKEVPRLHGIHGSFSRERRVFDLDTSSARMGAIGDATIRECDPNAVRAAVQQFNNLHQ